MKQYRHLAAFIPLMATGREMDLFMERVNMVARSGWTLSQYTVTPHGTNALHTVIMETKAPPETER